MRVDWARRATEDVQRLWLFLADRDPGYADRVEARLREAADLVGKLPRIGRPGATPDTRLWSVIDVQYVLEYRIDDDRVLIARVRSTRQEWDD